MSGLEKLPNELITPILFQIPNQDTLQALIQVSPACHAAYLMVRDELLPCILEEKYGPFLDLSEAIAAIRSKGLYMALEPEKAIALLDSWRRRDEICELRLTPATRLDKPKSLEECFELLGFYRELEFFVDDYAKNAPRPKWIDAQRWRNEFLPLKLSMAEKSRIFRALCRLQINANIYGKIEEGVEPKLPHVSNYWEYRVISPFDAWRLFFGTMYPWEAEEFGCIWSYLSTRFDPVYEEISKSLRECNVDFFSGTFRRIKSYPAL